MATGSEQSDYIAPPSDFTCFFSFASDTSEDLDARSGDDTVVMGNGNDTAWGSEGNDTILGGGDNDAIFGGLRYDRSAESGDDLLDGGRGVDYVFGDDGNDTILGGDGDDADIISSTSGAVQQPGGLFGGDGNDLIAGGEGGDKLQGDAGNDTMLGGSGSDLVWGDAGNDTLDGGDDNDVVDGSIGDDHLTGGAGADLFWIGSKGDIDQYGPYGNDLILDFTKGADHIGLKGFDWDDITITPDGDGSWIQIADARVDTPDATIEVRNAIVSKNDGDIWLYDDEGNRVPLPPTPDPDADILLY